MLAALARTRATSAAGGPEGGDGLDPERCEGALRDEQPERARDALRQLRLRAPRDPAVPGPGAARCAALGGAADRVHARARLPPPRRPSRVRLGRHPARRAAGADARRRSRGRDHRTAGGVAALAPLAALTARSPSPPCTRTFPLRAPSRAGRRAAGGAVRVRLRGSQWRDSCSTPSRGCAASWPVRLELLGAPGPGTATSEAWLGRREARSVREAIEFSGRLPAQELSDELARCAVLLCAASPGPTSRKGTLAGSLASGGRWWRSTGHLTWAELREQDAARVVARRRRRARRRARTAARRPSSARPSGARGRAFHDRRMAAACTAGS